MKKIVTLAFVFALVSTLLAFTPSRVSATPPPPPAVEIEEWYWDNAGVSGEVLTMYTITTPREWYQLKADPIKINGPAQICRPFRAGRFGWVGEIFQQVGDSWVKLPTTVGWVADEEGKYTVCAKAPAAGTYALFGYWVRPANYVEPEIVESQPEPF